MYRNKPSITGILRSALLLTIFAAGCGGTGGSVFARPPIGARVQVGDANHTAQSTQELYVASTRGDVIVYSIGSNPAIVQTISSGVPKPGGIWIDQNDILFAVNLPGDSPQTSLSEYKHGASLPFRTIVNGIVNCEYVAVDDSGNVYVAGMDIPNRSFFLEIYKKGRLNPSQTLTIPHSAISRLSGLAFDSTGALLVGESVYLQKGLVYRLAPGTRNFVNLNLQKATGGTIAVDGAGNLYVGSGSSAGDQIVTVYPPNSDEPSRKIAVQNILEALAVAPDGRMYLETTGSGQDQISVYAAGGNKPEQTFTIAGGGGGIALSR
jgi:hypothetical protein